MRFTFHSFDDVENFINDCHFKSRIYSSDFGYQSVNCFFIIPYTGRYGKGFKVHYPSKFGFKYGGHSNSFYRVDYIIF